MSRKCCNRTPRPACGECEGTAPLQYQLTVPLSAIINQPAAYPVGCEDGCNALTGEFLLDYDPDYVPVAALSDATCCFVSPEFPACYLCQPINPFDPEEGNECLTQMWRWVVELQDEFEDDGDVLAYVYAISTSPTYIFMYSGYFTGNNCAGPIDINHEPFFLNAPPPGCTYDEAIMLALGAAA